MTAPITIKVPYTGSKVIRKVYADWPHCPEHEEIPLVRRHPHSLYYFCSGGHHFVSQSEAINKKVLAYEVEEHPRSN